MFSVVTSVVSNLFLWFWLLAAVFIWWATKANRKARRRGVILLILFWFLGTRLFAEALLWPLETRYAVPTIASLQKQGVKQVVVLTGGGYSIQGEMLSSTFPHASMYRYLGGLGTLFPLGTRVPDYFLRISRPTTRGSDRRVDHEGFISPDCTGASGSG